MEISQILEKYINFLWTIFEQDMSNLSHWWMWAFLAIPGIGYLLFFFGRWCVITTPFWLPIFLMLSGIKRFPGPHRDRKPQDMNEKIKKTEPDNNDRKEQ